MEELYIFHCFSQFQCLNVVSFLLCLLFFLPCLLPHVFFLSVWPSFLSFSPCLPSFLPSSAMSLFSFLYSLSYFSYLFPCLLGLLEPSFLFFIWALPPSLSFLG
ncbi:hypothetical protein AMECASPLE_033031 [Ameca splendens]|uniref:Uncharacterized protein n=1 Tax=Ameca splendens TaxID=208324 RepID=A0ABV0ZSM4_9TELE